MNSTCTECGHTQPVHFQWSHTKPTMEGWYWYLGVEYGGPVILEVRPCPQVLCAILFVRKTTLSYGKEFKSVGRMSGQWSQRIPAPL